MLLSGYHMLFPKVRSKPFKHNLVLAATLTVCHTDEWVDGKFLPKGTVCFVNLWGLHHDESKFPDHDTFDPDHFKGRTMLAAEYANSSDYEKRDHYSYGMLQSWPWF